MYQIRRFMSELHHLFPTVVSVNHDFLTEEETSALLHNVDETSEFLISHGTIVGDNGSSHGQQVDILNRCSKEIKNKITNALNEYGASMGMHEMCIINSWYNIQRKGSSLNAHNHPNSRVSEALYLKTDEYSSNIYFHNANPYQNFECYQNETDLNYGKYWIKPKVGTLIFFPSWLTHSGDVNESDERICISFNSINQTHL